MIRSCLLLALITIPVLADEALDRELAALRAAPEAEREGAIARILERAPDATVLAEALARGPSYPAAESEWSIRAIKGADGVERPYHLRVPAGYQPSKPHGLLFQLHGGVGGPQLPEEGRLIGMRMQWELESTAAGLFVVIPTAQQGAEWWSPVGMGNLTGILATLKREFNLDEDRVHLLGFSDGASGALHFALHHPTPFASYVALSGHIAVSQAAAKAPVFLHNLRGARLFVASGGRDQLYPAGQVTPFVDAMKQAGAEVEYRVHLDAGHDPSYLSEDRPLIAERLRSLRRDPHPTSLASEVVTAGPSSRRFWIQIDELGAAAGDSELADLNVVVPARLMLGITIDRNHSGTGVKVESVAAGSPAATAGVLAGDLVVGVDGAELTGLMGLRSALGAKSWGDAMRLDVMRGAERHELKATFATQDPQPQLDRSQPSGRLEARRDGQRIEVRSRGVRRFALLLGVGALVPGQPIDLVVNGVVETLTPEYDPRFMIEQHLRDADRRQLYWGRISRTLEAR